MGRLRRALAAALALVAVVALMVLLVAEGAGRTTDAAPRSTGPSPTAAGSSTPDGEVPATTELRPAASAVLATAPSTPAADPARVQAALAGPLGDPALGSRVGASVVDLTTGAALLDRQAGVGLTPASTTKLLTAATVLELLGARHRFTTRVSWRPSTGELVLVGGGDPLLSRTDAPPGDPSRATSFPALAAATVAALQRLGVTTVALRVDDGLFAAGLPASWPRGYVAAGIVSPTSALALDSGRVAPGQARRDADPALAAADELGGALTAAGVAVAGPVDRTASTPDDQQVAAARSAPLADVVEQVLVTSDNDGAEVLGRHAALAAGQPPTPDGAAAALTSGLTGFGVDAAGAQVLDASGLSPASKVPPAVLTAVLRAAAVTPVPDLRAVLTGLPVAAFSGTLAERYEDPAERPGAGLVRAKTGTLTGVSALAGVVTAADGHPYVFAFLADAVRSTDAARDALDRAAAALAGCGCAA